MVFDHEHRPHSYCTVPPTNVAHIPHVHLQWHEATVFFHLYLACWRHHFSHGPTIQRRHLGTLATRQKTTRFDFDRLRHQLWRPLPKVLGTQQHNLAVPPPSMPSSHVSLSPKEGPKDGNGREPARNQFSETAWSRWYLYP